MVKYQRFPRLIRLLFLAIILILLNYDNSADAQSSLTLISPAFSPGSALSADYTCSGSDKSPALTWRDAPSATRSFALVTDDQDAPGGTFIHWVAYNLPASATALIEGVPRAASIPGGGSNGVNSFGHVGYNGPCPPPGQLHHYQFHLYALDSTLNMGESADASAVQAAIKGHVLASAELTGTFSR